MKKLVIDASVCLKWVFEEEDSEKARFLLKQQERNKLLLLVPQLWEYEIVNGFASAILRKKVPYQKANKLLKLVLQANLEIIGMSDLLLKCLENAKKYQISAYDSAYVTLAKENKIVLASADDRLVEKVGNKKLAVSLKELEP
ncbi:type II toxin-antitoxin system VapC family toxin [Candidatus Gottesmanbacteria bacterium]|nr:type II toxin-antitoxin system VapC family toxin [Candidatus Gottesmanbacteria bacterium]